MMLSTYTSPRPSLPRSPSPLPTPSPSPSMASRPSLRRQPRFDHPSQSASINTNTRNPTATDIDVRTQSNARTPSRSQLRSHSRGHSRNASISISLIPSFEEGAAGLSRLLSSSCVAMLARGGEGDVFMDSRTPIISITGADEGEEGGGGARCGVDVDVPMLRLQPAEMMVSASLETVLFGGEPAMDIELEEDIENASSGLVGMHHPFGAPTSQSSPAKGTIFSPRPSLSHSQRDPRRRTSSNPNPSRTSASASASKHPKSSRRQGGGKKVTSSVGAGSPFKTPKKHPRQHHHHHRRHGRKASKREALSPLDMSNLSLASPSSLASLSSATTTPGLQPSSSSASSYFGLAEGEAKKSLFRTNFQNAVVDFGRGSLSSRNRHSFRNLPTTTNNTTGAETGAAKGPSKFGFKRFVPGASSVGKKKGKEAIEEGWEMDFDDASEDGEVRMEEFGGWRA